MIHQIWLTDTIPPRIQKWMRGWQQFEYKLWQYKDVEMYMPLIYQAELQSAPPALQSDLLRLLILKEHGGMYIDCDCELIAPIPAELPISMVGHWFEGADPFIINVKPNDINIQTMLDYGWARPSKLHEVYRWGFKAFNKFWPGTVLDVQDWCRHQSQHSWGAL